MGGNISVTLRTPDGKEYRMERFTNVISYNIQNLDLMHNNMSHIKAFISTWEEMVEDYEENKNNGNFKFEMTDIYVPGNGLAPSDYGLIVIDMKNQIILSYNGYSNLEEISAIYMTNLFREDSKYHLFGGGEEDERNRFEKLFKSKKIKNINRWNDEKKGFGIISITDDYDEIVQKLKKGWKHLSDSFVVNFSPYIVENFKFGYYKNESIAMKKRVEELGFIITSKEEKRWNKEFQMDEK